MKAFWHPLGFPLASSEKKCSVLRCFVPLGFIKRPSLRIIWLMFSGVLEGNSKVSWGEVAEASGAGFV